MRSVIFAAALTLAGCGPTDPVAERNGNAGMSGPAVPDTGAKQAATKTVITLAKAGQIRAGMTYEEVRAVLGSEGFLLLA